jgi:Domain of unknown function (DUF4282)
MTLDDLKKIFMAPTLFRLDTLLASRLVPILYAVGLAAILLLAVSHLFYTFGQGWSTGLWGLLELVVFGLFYLIVLRVGCEVLLVFFKTHATATEVVSRGRIPSTLLDEVRDAIHDLAEDTDEHDGIVDATDPAPLVSTPDEMEPETPPRGPVVKRTAKRTPPAKL